MKILGINKNFIGNISEIFRKKICNSFTIKKNLPNLQPQLESDVVDFGFKLKDLKIGDEINRGRNSIVYGILNQPNLVAKVNIHNTTFKTDELSFKNSNPTRHIIAANDNYNIVIMQKIEGEPLFGKGWINKQVLSPEEYFAQLEEIKSIPDEAFIKYYQDLLALRKQGYEFDTVNPNNILYDRVKQKFNFVDIEKCDTNSKVTIGDFYPFIDGAGVGRLYENSSEETQKALRNETRLFFDRIEQIGNKLGVNLSNKNYIPDYNYIPYRFEDY